MFKLYKLVFFSLFVNMQVNGQGNNLTVQLFDYNAGFNSYNIKSIAQDKYGFIWAGTQDGVFFFNGKKFEKLINKAEYNQAKDVKKILYEPLKNEMWIAYSTNGIEIFNCNTHEISKRIYLKNENDSTILQVIKNINFLNDSVYISSDEGLFILPTASIRSKTTLINPVYRNIEVKDIFYFNGTKYGVLNKKGIFKFSGNNILKNIFPFSNSIRSSINVNNLVYSVSENNMVIYDLIKDKTISIETEFITNTIINWQNSILCATNKGLYQINRGNKFFKLNIANNFAMSLNDFAITAFADIDNNLWAGFSKCLACINPKPASFIGYNKAKPKYDKLNHVYFIVPVSSNEIVLGDLDGLLLLNKISDSVEILDTSKITYSLFKLDSNKLFYSNQNGVFTVSCKERKVIPINKTFSEWEGVSKNVVRCIEKINNDSFLLFQQIKARILLWNVKQKQLKEVFISDRDHFVNNTIYALKKINDSIIIICCEKSILIYNYRNGNYSEKKYLHPVSKEQLNFYFDAISVNKNLWIACYGYGVIILNEKYEITKIIDINSGLSDNGVYKILSDAVKNVWVSTNNGINKIEPLSAKVDSYSSADGLHSNMFEQYGGAEYNGELFFSGIDGFTNIIPHNVSSNKKIPQLYITEMVFYSKIGIRKSIDIDTDKIIIQNDVDQTTITLASTSFESIYKNSFFYKIDKINNEWISLENKNEISLLGLGPGSYNLYAKTSNSSGVFNSKVKLIVLEVLPKWYQTWWFKLLVFLATAGIIYAFYRYRIRQIEKQHAIRKNIATDLHDDLGSTLNSVKVFTNLAISGVKQEESLQQVKDNLTEATMSLRDMIWVLDDSLDTVDELVTRLKQFAFPITAASNMGFVITAGSDVNSRTLTKEEKRNLFLICKEAINNSIKYSGATQITVDIIPAGKKIQITVADNGKGFDEATVKKGYGLKNMQYRAAQIKYTVELVSAVGNGTRASIKPA